MQTLSATIKWHDSDYLMHTSVAIDEEWEAIDEEDDQNIFYYFDSKEELELAKQPEPNGFEFQLIEIEESN